MSLKELQNQIDTTLKGHPVGSTFSAILPPSLPTWRNRMEIEGPRQEGSTVSPT